MAPAKAVFTRETFQFFKDLGRHNRKEWMDANRDRYRAAIVQPFRRLLEELAPAALELDTRFDTSGRTGANFSRINRDIRFAKDKTLYKTHMYLKVSVPPPAKRETGQLYVGLSVDTVTAGFRIYSGGNGRSTTVGPPPWKIGKRYWRGLSAVNSRPLRPRARRFRAKSQKYSASSTPCCASRRSPTEDYNAAQRRRASRCHDRRNPVSTQQAEETRSE